MDRNAPPRRRATERAAAPDAGAAVDGAPAALPVAAPAPIGGTLGSSQIDANGSADEKGLHLPDPEATSHRPDRSVRPDGAPVASLLPQQSPGGGVDTPSPAAALRRDRRGDPAESRAGRRDRRHATAPARGGIARGALAGAGRLALSVLVAFALWQAVIVLAAPPRYMLPAPADVAAAYRTYAGRLVTEAAVTLAEALLGLVAGIAAGLVTGLAVGASPLAGRLLTPVLVVSQALPVFALAPLLVLWFGFGLASKVVMATLVIYFPVASALADGLGRTDPGLLDLARLSRAGRWRSLMLIRLPAALPDLVSGIRVAAVFAPIGAVIGEWVGASRGLGLLMVQANARMQTDLLFAALGVLAVAALALKTAVDALTRRLIPWAEAPEAPRSNP